MEEILIEREFIIDSRLMRVMKSRKQLGHHKLVKYCCKMITIFKPDGNLINKRIELLLERNYIRRDESDSNSYTN